LFAVPERRCTDAIKVESELKLDFEEFLKASDCPLYATTNGTVLFMSFDDIFACRSHKDEMQASEAHFGLVFVENHLKSNRLSELLVSTKCFEANLGVRTFVHWFRNTPGSVQK